MKIGIDVRSLLSEHRTGVGEYTYELLQAVFLACPNNDFFLLYSGQKKVTQYVPQWSQPNVHYAGMGWPNKIFNAATVLTRRPFLTSSLKPEQKLDLVFLPNINFTALPPATKYCLTIHDLSFQLFPQFFSAKQRVWHHLVQPKHLIKNAAHIFTPSDNTRRDVITFFKIPAEKVSTIYPGLCSEFTKSTPPDTERVKQKYNVPNQFILFLGTLEPRKNALAIILAFQELWKKNPLARNLKLIVAGAGGWKNSNVKKIIAADKNIISLGYVEEQDKRALYTLARVFVYPSFYEGFGLPVLEAMAAGTPVITSNRSSLVEVAGAAAYLVNPDRVDELVTGLERILFDAEVRTLYQTRGLAQAQKFFWEQTAREFMNVCNNL